MRELPNCYISKHGIYYVRLRIPYKLRQYTTQTEIRMSLQTRQIKTAHVRAIFMQGKGQAVFNWITSMTDKSTSVRQADRERILGNAD